MLVKAGYKNTEVGVIPKDWGVAKLASICSMKSGEGITSTRIDQFSLYPCYGGNGLRGFAARFTHNGSYALIGRQGALCGNVLGVDGKFYASEHAIVVAASDSTDIRWLTFVLTEMQLNKYSESSAQPGLSVSKLLNLYVAHPPSKKEQQAIATVLSDMDSLIASLDQLIAKKGGLKQAAMHQLLTGKKRLPGFNGVWEVKTLVDITVIQKGQMITEKSSVEGNIPVIAGGIQPSYYHDTFNRNENTITVSASGANAGYVSFHDSPIFASDCSTIEEGIQYDVKYLFYYLKLRQQDIFKFQSGGAQPHVYPEQLKTFKIDIPREKAEQTAIAAVLSDMDAEINEVEARLAKTRLIKQGIMQELLTGKTRLIGA